jgi:hypothetical protein
MRTAASGAGGDCLRRVRDRRRRVGLRQLGGLQPQRLVRRRHLRVLGRVAWRAVRHARSRARAVAEGFVMRSESASWGGRRDPPPPPSLCARARSLLALLRSIVQHGGQYHMRVAVMANACPLCTFLHNSQIVHASSNAVEGPSSEASRLARSWPTRRWCRSTTTAGPRSSPSCCVMGPTDAILCIAARTSLRERLLVGRLSGSV